MLISLGKINFKKYLFLFVPIIKLITEISGLKNKFYKVPNILIQYLFLCIAKFFNVIFWFILEKNIKIKRAIKEENYIKKENIDIIKESRDNKEDIEEIKRIYSKTSSKGLSQKEIDLFEIEKKKKKKFYKEIIFLIFISLIDIISNISYLVSYAYISHENKKNYNNSEKNNTNSNILEEILINYILSNSTDNSTVNNITKEHEENNDNIINIIPFRISVRIAIFFLLSLLFFYYDRPHRHQIISLLIIIITILFAGFLEILLNIQKNCHDIWIHLFITLIQEFFFCLYNILGSKYLTTSNSNAYKLLFFNGLFGILMMIVLHFTMENIHCVDLHIDDKFCNKYGTLKNFYTFSLFDRRLKRLIPSLLLTIIEMACTWLLIFNQTANHLAVAYSIHLAFRFLIGRNKLEFNHIIIGSLSFIIISFFALIYNEIFVLRFCNLDKNTSEEIEQRAIEDRLLVERISVENSYEIN